MREILFRGKRSDIDKFVYGDLFHDYDVFGHITASYIYEFDLMHGRCFQYEVDPETVGQFTGLPDNNKKKIFEGDILHVYILEESGEQEYNTDVIFDDGMYLIRGDSQTADYDTVLISYACDPYAPLVSVEIIGNIHENPELLGGEAMNKETAEYIAIGSSCKEAFIDGIQAPISSIVEKMATVVVSTEESI